MLLVFSFFSFKRGELHSRYIVAIRRAKMQTNTKKIETESESYKIACRESFH